jgi:hypothetical protein
LGCLREFYQSAPPLLLTDHCGNPFVAAALRGGKREIRLYFCAQTLCWSGGWQQATSN